jgi:hypothetical protein
LLEIFCRIFLILTLLSPIFNSLYIGSFFYNYQRLIIVISLLYKVAQ